MMPNNWQREYAHVWDTCCDHGQLGAELLNQINDTGRSNPIIHFVDIQPDIINKLEDLLTRFYSDKVICYKTHCNSTAELPLSDYQGKHLIVIAGVGGDLVADFIKQIANKHPNLAADFLLCPVRKIDELRSTLINLNFKCLDEKLVEENKRFYELMFVTNHSNSEQELKPVSLVGEKMWNDVADADLTKQYAKKMVLHYEKVLKQPSKVMHAKKMLSSYQGILEKEH